MPKYVDDLRDCITSFVWLRDLSCIVVEYAVWKITIPQDEEVVLFNDRMEIIAWNKNTDYAKILTNAFDAFHAGPPQGLSIYLCLDLYDSPIPQHIKLVELNLCNCRNGGCNAVYNAKLVPSVTKLRDVLALFADDDAWANFNPTIGWWFDYRSKGRTVLISETVSRLPDLCTDHARPDLTRRQCPVQMEPGYTYVTIASLRLW